MSAVGDEGDVVDDPATQEHVPGLPIQVPVGAPVDLGERGTGFARIRPGTGTRPPVVLLHGLTASGGINWMHSFGAIDPDRIVIAPDLRGHARGPRAARGVSIDDHVADVLALLRSLDVPRAVVVGFSFGGAVAQALALDHAEVIDGLVLFSTASRFRMGPITKRLYGAFVPVAKAAAGLPVGLRELLEPRFVPSPDAAIRSFVLEETRRHRRVELARNAQALHRFRSTPRLTEIDVPTAVVVTTKDRTLHPNAQRRLATDIPDAVEIETPTGHSGLLWEPERAMPALVQAIEVVTPATR